MNAKQGEPAEVIKGVYAHSPNIGKIVIPTHLNALGRDPNFGDIWTVQCDEGIIDHDGNVSQIGYMADDWLRPYTPPETPKIKVEEKELTS